MTDSTAGRPVISRRYSYLLLASVVMTYLLVTMGGTVCVTGSSDGCPDWPGCYGRIIPPAQTAAIIEYMHRFAAVLAFPFIVGAVIVSWWKYRSIRWLSRPTAMAIVFVLAVSAFGAAAVLYGLSPGLAAIDLGSALTALALLAVAAAVAFARRANPSLPDKLSSQGAFARLTLWTLGMVFLVLVSGVFVAGEGSVTRCLGWPMWSRVAVDRPGWPQTVRLVLAGTASLSIIAVVVQAWRTQRQQKAILSVATAAGLLFLLEMIVGVLLLMGNATAWLLVIYAATAAALWVMVVVLATLVGLASASSMANHDAPAS